MKVLITSGGTKVPIDGVRHIGNMSSGTFGSKIAYEALKVGHEVTFLMASGSKSPLGMRFTEKDSVQDVLARVSKNMIDRYWFSRRLDVYEYTDFTSYEEELYRRTHFLRPDVVVLAAAVSDYDVANKVSGKIRSKGDMNIVLQPLPKLISRFRGGNVGTSMPTPKVLVGFKLLVGSSEGELLQASIESISKNGCDLVVANDLRDIKAGGHKLLLVDPDGYRVVKSDPTDPNFLAREVVNTFTRIARAKGVR